MVGKIRLGISSCLLGERVRYDGGHKLDAYLKDTLGAFVEWVPVCPEVECGLPVPREAMRLVGSAQECRLVTIRTKVDLTERMQAWARKRVERLAQEHLSGFVFKSDSPSSGLKNVRLYDKNGVPARKGVGIFARIFTETFPLLPAEDDGRLRNDALRENFIERVFAFSRWQDFAENDASLSGLVDFHTRHKLLLMAHSPQLLGRLGALVAGAKSQKRAALFESYRRLFLEALAQEATVKKNTNVLQHVLGYFKERLTPGEKQEALEVIGQYHRGLIPLIVPVVLLRHFVRTYDEPYLKAQYYLDAHPAELMLRNHV